MSVSTPIFATKYAFFAFFEIYKIPKPLHSSNLKILQNVDIIFLKFQKFCQFFVLIFTVKMIYFSLLKSFNFPFNFHRAALFSIRLDEFYSSNFVDWTPVQSDVR